MNDKRIFDMIWAVAMKRFRISRGRLAWIEKEAGIRPAHSCWGVEVKAQPFG
ncbi:MAG: hypothetical protein OXC57_10190 [Rhodobacteraceae bacterium]|nr:hypothetical protein [Paracoccaceae bacterium]